MMCVAVGEDKAPDISFIAELTDVFRIGGTKSGALIGEAIVIPNQELSDDFEYLIKQRGALLSKGRLLGLQFKCLFENNLFFEINKHANSLAQRISNAVLNKGFTLSAETESNQIFPVLPNSLIELLSQRFEFYIWKAIDADNSIVRLVTSWATEEAKVSELVKIIEDY